MIQNQISGGADDKYRDEFVSVKTDEGQTVVARSRVWWIEVANNWLRLHTSTGESYLCRGTLKGLEQRWGQYGFVRIHKSYLVFFPRVREVRLGGWGYVVLLGSGAGAAELPVGRTRLRELKQKLEARNSL